MKKTIFLSFILLICFSFSCMYGSDTESENDDASCSRFLQMRITNDENCDKFKITRTYKSESDITTEIICYKKPCRALTRKLLRTIIRMDEVALREIESYRKSDSILSSDSDDSDSDDCASDGKLSPRKEKKCWISQLIPHRLKWLFM